MEKRITIRLPQQIYDSVEAEARNMGVTISDVIRERIKHSLDFGELSTEIRKLREDLDYLIDQGKRKEYAESRVI
jgi:Arc/MetJ-type ribon-helix-helix transcriptional regulator